MTGLSHAHGENVFLIDSDLEEEPEWLLSFSQQMEQDRCDVVYGVQERRKGGLFERWSGEWFYRFFRVLTGLTLPENIVTARLMTRRYVDALVRHDEREVFIAGLWHITGFDQRPQTVTKRNTSETTYTFRRKMSIFVNSVTSFSNAPLKAIFYIGVAVSLLAGGYTSYLIINWLVLCNTLEWMDFSNGIHLASGGGDHFIHRCNWHLSVQDLHGDQTSPIHHCSADI